MTRALREQKGMGYSRPLCGSRMEKVTSYSFAQSFATGGFPLQIALRSPFLLSVILLSLACTDASDGGR